MDKHKGLFVKLGDKIGDLQYSINKVSITNVTAQKNPPEPDEDDDSYTITVSFVVKNAKALAQPTDLETIKNTCIKEKLTFWPFTDDESAFKKPEELTLNVTGNPQKAQAFLNLNFKFDPGKVNNSAGIVLKETDKFLMVFDK